MDEAASLLAARLFHGGPAEPSPDWSPVDWQAYPEGGRGPHLARRRGPPAPRPGLPGRPPVPHPPAPPDPMAPTLSRVLDHLTTPNRPQTSPQTAEDPAPEALARTAEGEARRPPPSRAAEGERAAHPFAGRRRRQRRPRPLAGRGRRGAPPRPPQAADGEHTPQGPPAPTTKPARVVPVGTRTPKAKPRRTRPTPRHTRSAALAAGITAELAREEPAPSSTRPLPPAARNAPAGRRDGVLPPSRCSPSARPANCSPTTSRRWCAARPSTPPARSPPWTGWTALPAAGRRAGRRPRTQVRSLIEEGTQARCATGWPRRAHAPKPVRLV